MRYFVDTCIWIDLLEDRKGRDGEPLGEYAARFFMKMAGKTLYTSDITIKELRGRFSDDEIRSMMLPFRMKTIIASKEQFEESFVIAERFSVPKGDALHAIIARDNGLMLITRDRHFSKLCRHKKPEDVI